ncbi:hypothetical protein QJQ45_000876 [Haematococcus lacustris]|nr:hypothetical protein QJQ45_000876 [Haematococcus lacustris]
MEIPGLGCKRLRDKPPKAQQQQQQQQQQQVTPAIGHANPCQACASHHALVEDSEGYRGAVIAAFLALYAKLKLKLRWAILDPDAALPWHANMRYVPSW